MIKKKNFMMIMKMVDDNDDETWLQLLILFINQMEMAFIF